MAVTHPLWPSKEPRKRSDSDIFGEGVLSRRQTWAGSHRHINSHCDLTVQYLEISLKIKSILRKQYVMLIPVIGKILINPQLEGCNSPSFVVDADPGVDDVLAMFVLLNIIRLHY